MCWKRKRHNEDLGRVLVEKERDDDEDSKKHTACQHKVEVRRVSTTSRLETYLGGVY